MFHQNCIKHGISAKPRTLPHRPKTHSRAERFHGVLENGVRCFFFVSMVPYLFCVHAAQTFCSHYSWSWTVTFVDPPRTSYEFIHGQPYAGEFREFGSLCYYLTPGNEKPLKFGPKQRTGAFLSYGVLKSYHVLDFDRFVCEETRGSIYVVNTRDVKGPSETEFPFAMLSKADPEVPK